MSIQASRIIVRDWSEVVKNRVRQDCQRLDALTDGQSQQTTVKVSAPFAYITEKCFDRRSGDVSTEQILALL